MSELIIGICYYVVMIASVIASVIISTKKRNTKSARMEEILLSVTKICFKYESMSMTGSEKKNKVMTEIEAIYNLTKQESEEVSNYIDAFIQGVNGVYGGH